MSLATVVYLLLMVLFSRGYSVRGVCNGLDADPGEFPSFAQIVHFLNSELEAFIGISADPSIGHACGGTIVSKRYIVTAAHCLLEYKQHELKVIIGSIWRNGSGGDTYFIEKVFPHENYDLPTSPADYDIAIIKLTTEINLKEGIVTVAQYAERAVHDFDIVHFAGLGRDSETSWPNRLQKLRDGRAITLATCKTRDCPQNVQVDSVFAMGSNKKHPSGTMDGDSGSGLFDTDSRLIGVASSGFTPCGSQPDIYVDVLYHKDWLFRTMEASDSCEYNLL